MTTPLATSGIPARRLVISVVLVMVSVLPAFLLGASFIQLEADLDLTATGLGFLTAIFFVAAAFSSTPLGRVVERIGWRRSMRINLVISTAILVLIAGFGTKLWVLATLMVIGGLVYGFANPAANLALAERSASTRRGLVFGLKHAGIPASTLFAGAAVPLLIVNVGWRPTFAVAALLAPLVWILIETEPDGTSTEAVTRTPYRDLQRRQLVILALGSAFATWAAVSLGVFLVAAAVEASLSESQAGILLFAGSAASITARIVAGSIADRTGTRGFTGVSLMMAIGAAAFVLISLTVGPAFAAAVVLGFAFGWGWPGLLTYSVVNTDPEAAASTSAITQAGIFIGAGIGPITLGWIVDTWSFQVGWLLIAVFLVIASLIVLSIAIRVNKAAAAA